MKTLQKSTFKELGVAKEFNNIILNKLDGYNGTKKEKLKSFLKDLRRGGCQSGIIGEFIYNSDCKDFYIKYIDDLEQIKEELEEQLGNPIKNRFKLAHYVFMCWLCFEEYCFDIYRTVFEFED